MSGDQAREELAGPEVGPSVEASIAQDQRWSRLGAKLAYYVPSAVTLIALLLFWQFAVDYWQVKEFILPSPLRALEALFDPHYRWPYNLSLTLTSVIGAFIFTSLAGLIIGTILVWSTMLERVILPILVLFNTLPKIALAPMFIFWIGYGVKANIVIGVAVAFFPMVLNTAAGLRSVEPELLDLLRALKARKWQVFLKIRLPNALPYIFVGLKLNAVFATVGAIVGEFIASTGGLGAVIIVGNTTLDTPAIFASLILISAIGLALYLLVIIAERIVMPWEFRDTAAP